VKRTKTSSPVSVDWGLQDDEAQRRKVFRRRRRGRGKARADSEQMEGEHASPPEPQFHSVATRLPAEDRTEATRDGTHPIEVHVGGAVRDVAASQGRRRRPGVRGCGDVAAAAVGWEV